MKKLLFPVLIAIGIHSAGAQVVSIATARTSPLGSTVTVRGLVLNGEELGSIRYLQDNTGAIAAYDFSLMAPVMAGYSMEVTGVLYNYNGLLELSPVTSLTIINSGNPLPAPEPVTLSSGWVEGYEARLVQVSSVEFTATGTFSTAGSGTNYDLTDGVSTGQVRVLTSTNIDGTAIPEEEVNVTGIMSQYAPGGTGGYQLLPRGLEDISTGGNPPVISSVLAQSNITTSSFTVSFETLYEGNTIIYYGTSEDALTEDVADASLTVAHSIDLTGLTDGTIYYLKAASVSATNDTSWSPLTAMATQSNSTGEMRIWFNNPVNNGVSTGTNAFYNPDFVDTIIWFIDHALYSIDMAIYNIDNENNIINALNDAYLRGVNVRFIADDGVNAGAYAALNIGPGKKIKAPTGELPGGGFYGIMHNKFIVIDAVSTDPDEPWVISGSTNMTDAQLKVDKQNMIAIQDQSLAKAFRAEFEEMFAGTFGPLKTNNTPHQFIIGGKEVELYFSPSDDTESQIKRVIAESDYDMYFAVFTFTRFGISYDIESAIERGVFVAGIYDETDPSNPLAIDILEGAMSSTLFQASGPIFHHKYLISDPYCPASDPMVLTGSHNWSTSAQVRNDDNTLIIHDSTIANIYYQEFAQRYTDEGGTIVVDGFCDFVPVSHLFAEARLQFFPNPAQQSVAIELPLGSEGGLLQLLDISGKEVFHQRLSQPTSVIELHGLANGMYMVRYTTPEKIYSGRLIINR